MQKESIKKWGIGDYDILAEMDRQELPPPSNDDEQNQNFVTLLFAMKWFNSELTNKGLKSELVKGLLIEK